MPEILEREATMLPAPRIGLKAEHRIRANPANAIVAVVNMQNDFCKPGGAIFDQRPLEDMPTVIRATRRLVERARTSGIPVIFVQSVRTLEEPEFVVYGHVPMVKVGSWGAEIIEELTPQPGDAVVQAWTHDPFYCSKLGHVVDGLVEEPTKTLALVAGGDICGLAYQTVMRFYLPGFWTVLVLDALYGDQAGRQFTINNFSGASRVNVFLSRSELVAMSSVRRPGVTGLTPDT